jgi:hypothetical protein
MMKQTNVSLLLSGYLIMFIFCSCNRYIDAKNKSIRLLDGSFAFYPDRNELVYKSVVGLKRDHEILKPKPFQVKLPKKIKYYEFAVPSEFAFYYDKNQVVFIRIDLENSAPLLDTSYVPSAVELRTIIQQWPTGSHAKNNVREIDGRPDRINKLIRKGDATILLYNVVKNNEYLFVDYLNSFTFLNP